MKSLHILGGERPEPAQWVEGKESELFEQELISSIRVAEGTGERRAKVAWGFEPSDGADSIPNQISNHSDVDRRKMTSFWLY